MLQIVGVCTVVRADHITNAAGKPGGRVTVQSERGELVQVPLSQVREYAILIEDGLARLELEAKARWTAENG